jgi:ATP-dependent RNA helicase DeaD
LSPPETPDFASLGLSGAVLRAVYEVGYESPTPIQAAAIGPLMEGHDLLGQAQTGTGKTAAFALPLLSRLNLAIRKPQILVLTPTRELAIQVAEAMQTYARYMEGFHVIPVYGGQSYSLQLRPLQRGIHAVVGTPGRVLDHLRRGSMKLDAISAVVLDEADEMLRMGFIDDVEKILQQTPKEKQLALFSATMPSSIRSVADRHTRNPVAIRIESKTSTVSTVTQSYWPVSSASKLDAMTRILETEDFDAMLIFVRTKSATAELAERLEARGFSSAALNGDMNQASRESTVERLKAGRLDILVATDVAARGLDVERVSHVINYDIPHDTEAYVHRIGRTARAGRTGKAILFVAPRERRMLRAIERATGQPITPMNIPSKGDVASKRAERFKAALSEVVSSKDLSLYRSVIASYQVEHGTELEEIAAALAHMAQGDRPLFQVKEPEVAQQPSRGFDDSPAPAPRPRERERGPRDAPARLDGDASPKKKRKDREAVDAELITYRIEVGETHGVKPGNIVGAIANEAGLDSEYIGAIDINSDHSFVDLPGGMPGEIFKHLRKVRVCGQALNLVAASDYSMRRDDTSGGDKFDGEKSGDDGDKPAKRAPKKAHRGKSDLGKSAHAKPKGGKSKDKKKHKSREKTAGAKPPSAPAAPASD